MQITITGPRGCGKTTVAIELGKWLRSKGFAVTMAGPNQMDTSIMQDQLMEKPDPDAFTKPNRVVILDGFEMQDDADARMVTK